jgi:hypothetical protein
MGRNMIPAQVSPSLLTAHMWKLGITASTLNRLIRVEPNPLILLALSNALYGIPDFRDAPESKDSGMNYLSIQVEATSNVESRIPRLGDSRFSRTGSSPSLLSELGSTAAAGGKPSSPSQQLVDGHGTFANRQEGLRRESEPSSARGSLSRGQGVNTEVVFRGWEARTETTPIGQTGDDGCSGCRHQMI